MSDALDGSPVLAKLGDALDALRMFHGKLEREGEPRGLIGPRDVNIIWERHILNSAVLAEGVRKIADDIQALKQMRIADVGSGGGFPGLVLAAMLPQCSLTLIEPMERRITWLRECVDAMQLDNVTLRHARAQSVIEDVEQGVVPPFDIVTCRAVAPLVKLSGWTLPLLHRHGYLIALKGQSVQEEIERARKVLRRYGGGAARVEEVAFDPSLAPTHVLYVEKVR